MISQQQSFINYTAAGTTKDITIRYCFLNQSAYNKQLTFQNIFIFKGFTADKKLTNKRTVFSCALSYFFRTDRDCTPFYHLSIFRTDNFLNFRFLSNSTKNHCHAVTTSFRKFIPRLTTKKLIGHGH